jgi:uncharacterized protein (DUF1501 family)
MNRRDFFTVPAAFGAALMAPSLAWANAQTGYQNLLILVELKGGNDGLNTLVPFADPGYAALRPRIGIARDTVLQLDDKRGLHPSLQPLMPLWEQKELAVVQGLGYPQPSLSHFRSIDIWDTASKSEQYLTQGWLTRTFAAHPTPLAYSADAVILGSQELGPLAGGARAIALANTEQFLNSARLATAATSGSNPVLAHALKVEADILKAADGMKPARGKIEFKTQYPPGAFGNAVKAAAQVVANGELTGKPVAMLRLTLGGFDTHQNQLGTHAALLKQLAEGLAALKSSMVELNRWDRTLVMTYSEFGRRPKENLSGGTDHGTVAPHFVLGGRVKGGLFGATPALTRLDGSGNLAHAVDFRSMYATVLQSVWGMDSADILGGKFASLDLMRA